MAESKIDGIEKKIIFPGQGPPPSFNKGAKLTFHYVTKKCNDEQTVIDDSRKYSKPMELLLGKKFQLEIWEVILRTMRVKEVASFKCDKDLVDNYSVVAKRLRDVFSGKPVVEQKHCCGMMSAAEQSLGYEDLDKLFKEPEDLEFTMELLKVEEPGEYKQETWSMTDKERQEEIPRLKVEGNALFKEKKYEEACLKYGEALTLLENLSAREKPHEDEWEKLKDRQIPFLLNFCQCKLFLKDYYPVIEHTTTVLERDPENVKALFRRAKAHAAVWDFKEARRDFNTAKELDPTITNTVKKELKILDDIEEEKLLEEKNKLQGKLFT